MTWKQGSEYADTADERRQDKQFVEAGDYYTQATYEYIGDSGPNPDRSKSSKGLHYLAMGAICYRLGDRYDWCRNRCQQGVLIAESISERALSRKPSSNQYEIARRGAWAEYIGDFKILGDIDNAEEAYEVAKDVYREAEDPRFAIIEQEHMRLVELFRKIGIATEYNLEELYRLQQHHGGGTLTEWVDYKQEHLSKVLERLLKQGGWKYENNSNHGN